MEVRSVQNKLPPEQDSSARPHREPDGAWPDATLPGADRATRWCLFLDVDGTLLDFEEAPTAVRAPDDLKTLLAAAATRLNGALALVSGRSIRDLDTLFAPLKLPAAGVHGLERRDGDGNFHRSPMNPASLDPARAHLQSLPLDAGRVLIEDKGLAIAIHFRRAPERAAEVRAAARAALATLGPGFHLLEGACVIELKAWHGNKARAVDAFMQERPFQGRTPIFVGDDITDRDGFMAVLRHGGMAVAVGDRVSTRWRLPDPSAVRRWLAGIGAGADGVDHGP